MDLTATYISGIVINILACIHAIEAATNRRV